MRITKAMMASEIKLLHEVIKEQKHEISELKGKLSVYEKFTNFYASGNIAIERVCDSIAHVLTDLNNLRKSREQ